MTTSLNSNRSELHRVVLRAKPRGREQKPQNLGIGLGGPAGHDVQQQEHQQPSKQAVEQVERGGTEAHSEEEQFPLGAEDR
jgi:hypothetical protein